MSFVSGNSILKILSNCQAFSSSFDTQHQQRQCTMVLGFLYLILKFFFCLGFYYSCLSKYEITCGFYLNSLAGEYSEHHTMLFLPICISSMELSESFDHFLNWVCWVSVIELQEFFHISRQEMLSRYIICNYFITFSLSFCILHNVFWKSILSLTKTELRILLFLLVPLIPY